MRKLIAATVFLPTAFVALADAASPVAAKIASKCRVVKTDDFYGFRRTVFDFNGEQAWVVEPEREQAGRPWTWTMEWPTAFVKRTGALAMLKRGYHHVSLTGGRYLEDGTFKVCSGNMNDKRLAASRAFQKFLVEELGFAPQAKLIGMSWGGFFSIRYAGTYPGCVSRMYLDCPLCDFTTLRDWKTRWGILDNYGVTTDYVGKDDPRMPVNMAEKVAAGGTEIFLLYGGQDSTVPPATNCERFVPRFRAAGGKIQIGVPRTYEAGDFGRNAYGHHPHGLEPDEQQPLVDFFERGIGQ